MTAGALYDQYVHFGDDPYVVPVNPKDPPVALSACAYAKGRRRRMTNVSVPLVNRNGNTEDGTRRWTTGR